ncbi:MAG: CAP domain-containing protein [Actinomycetota bacterium]
MRKGHTRSRCGKAVVGFLLVLALLAPGIATDHARAAASQARREQMLALTNEARATHGKRALDLNAKLSRYATRHSQRMAEAGTLFHTEDLADKLNGLDWSMGGENVGVALSLTDLQDAFMGSKAHRKNILQKGYDCAAIGIVKSDGTLWVTVIFYG